MWGGGIVAVKFLFFEDQKYFHSVRTCPSFNNNGQKFS